MESPHRLDYKSQACKHILRQSHLINMKAARTLDIPGNVTQTVQNVTKKHAERLKRNEIVSVCNRGLRTRRGLTEPRLLICNPRLIQNVCWAVKSVLVFQYAVLTLPLNQCVKMKESSKLLLIINVK